MQPGRPGVATQLVGGGNVLLDGYRWFLRFEKEQPPAADAEAVVGRLGGAADLDGIFVHDFAEALRVAGAVVHVPAQQREQGVEKIAPQLGFVVLAALVVIKLLAEAGDELDESGRGGHGRFALGQVCRVMRL